MIKKVKYVLLAILIAFLILVALQLILASRYGEPIVENTSTTIELKK